MGYFDAVTNSSFKTTQDGRRLFFPWGTLGGGYAIASEQDYLRLRGQVKVYIIAALLLMIVSNLFWNYAAALAVAALFLGFYLVWMWRLLPRLAFSDERLTLQESLTAQAQGHGAVRLWLLEIASLVFVGCGFWILAVEPRRTLIALAVIVFFGLCAVVFARMLMLRRRTAAS